jgi:hypothetical protein
MMLTLISWEAETGSLRGLDQPRLHSKTLSQKEKKRNKKANIESTP